MPFRVLPVVSWSKTEILSGFACRFYSFALHAHKRFVDTLRNRYRRDSLLPTRPGSVSNRLRDSDRDRSGLDRRRSIVFKEKPKIVGKYSSSSFDSILDYNRAVFNLRRNRAASPRFRDETKRIWIYIYVYILCTLTKRCLFYATSPQIILFVSLYHLYFWFSDFLCFFFSFL